MRRVVIKDVLHWSYVGHSAFIPPGVTEPPLEIVFDLTSWDPGEEDEEDLLETIESEVMQELSPVGLERCRAAREDGGGRIDALVVRLRDQGAREAYEEGLRESWENMETDEDQEWLEEMVRLGVIRFEIGEWGLSDRQRHMGFD